MILRVLLLLCLGSAGWMSAAEKTTLVLAGTVTNTTGGASAVARLELVMEGETVTATLSTEAPLTGSGALTGRLVGGWLELYGKLNEGFQIKFRGALSGRDYRGTYLAAVPGQLVQYGRFQLARPAAAVGAR